MERKLLAEIDEIVGDDVPTYEQLQQLRYLPLVMKESMRYMAKIIICTQY